MYLYIAVLLTLCPHLGNRRVPSLPFGNRSIKPLISPQLELQLQAILDFVDDACFPV